MMKVYFTATELCSRRKLDEARAKEYFLQNDSEITRSVEEADCIVLTTCAFRKNRVRESKEKLEELLVHDKTLIVTGCFPDMERKVFEQLQRDNVIKLSPYDLKNIDGLFPQLPVAFRDIGEVNDFDNKYDDNVFFLRISNGCQFRCSYCSIKKAIGPLNSYSMDDIEKAVDAFLVSGKEALVLIGDDVGAYGRDNGGSFPGLLACLKEKLKTGNGRRRLKIGNLNPWWLLEYRKPLFQLLSDDLFEFLHVSVQSGSDRILSLMKRDYCRVDEIREVLRDLKKINPEVKLQTDFIVGFPTESDEDFHRSLELVDEGFFDIINFHKYYEAEGAESLSIKPKVDPDAIDKRYRKAVKALDEKDISSSIEIE